MEDNFKLKTDEELIELISFNEEEAIIELLKRYEKSLFLFIRRFSFSNDESADILQNIFIKIWKGSGKFDNKRAGAKTFIWTIARNTIYDALRKKRLFIENEYDNDEMLENVTDSTNIFSSILKKEEEENVKKLIKELNANEQTIFSLYYGEDMTFKEIGEILGKSVNTVKSVHLRAIKKLRTMLHQN